MANWPFHDGNADPCGVGRIRRVGTESSRILSRWLFPVGGCVTSRPSCRHRLTPLSFPSLGVVDWVKWREAAAIPSRTPFRLSPAFDYDVELNRLFLSGDMLCQAWNTQDGYARDLKAFLNFLWHNRNRGSRRDATTADHMAYLTWRRRDPAGPRVDDATWDREVTAVNRFYTGVKR
jgi:Phage integrase, N-terminal SAM-like domain